MLRARKHSGILNKDSTSVKPIIHLEQLEPRILLSGDSLLNIAPDPYQDTFLDNTPQVVQYAELLDTNEQVEKQISLEMSQSGTPNTDAYQPIFTLCVDDDNTNGESADADLSVDNIASAQVNGDITVLLNNSDEYIESKVGTTEDSNMPTYINDADLSTEYATSIEIRGPPASETVNSKISASYLNYEESEVELSILNEYAVEVRPSGTIDLPGLLLIDPDPSNLQGQVIYLDFDGEEGVTYNGPVVVEGIDIPEFSAESAGQAGQENAIISEILTIIEQEFDGTGVLFTTSKPGLSTSYSTIYIGGDDSAFQDYGRFWGLAEDVDFGNQNSGDKAFVFSESIISNHNNLTSLTTDLANVIAHETRHLLGYTHEYKDSSDVLSSVAQAEGGCITEDTAWDDLSEIVLFGNNGISIDKNVTINDGFIASNGDIMIDKYSQIQGILGDGKLSVGKSSTILDDIVVNGEVTINKDVVVDGNIDGGTIVIGLDALVDGQVTAEGYIILRSGSTVTGEVVPYGSPQVFSPIALPCASEFETNPDNDIVTHRGETTTLTPGKYGDLHLGVDNIINFSSGEYFFDRILTAGGLDLNLDLTFGRVAIYVLGNVNFGNDLDVFVNNVNVTDVDPELAAGVFIEIHGQWQLHKEGQWFGTIFAPNDSIVLHKDSTLIGAAYSGSMVRIKKGSTIDFVPLDTKPPVIEGALANDTGRADLPGSWSDHITSDPTIIGTITDTSTIGSIRVILDPLYTSPIDIIGDPAVQPDGSFVFDWLFFERLLGSPLADGDYTIWIQAEDIFGNTSDVFELPFTLDTTPPIVMTPDLRASSDSGISDNDNVTNITTPTIDIDTEADAMVRLLIDGIEFVQSTVGPLYTFTLAPLAEDSYVITATGEDVAGNIGTSDTLIIQIDTTAPVVTVDTLLTNDSTPELTGTVDDADAAILVTINGNSYMANNNGDGTWTLGDDTISPALADGTYDVSASATDLAGNVGTDATTTELTVDTTPPVATVDFLLTNDPTPELTGMVDDPDAAIKVIVDGNTYSAINNNDGTWTLPDDTISPALADGTYDVSISATDLAGNIGTDATTDELTIDTTAPVITVNTLLTNDSAPELTGTVDDAYAAVEVTVSGNTYITVNNGDGTWTLPNDTISPALSDGIYDISAIATDIVGNVGTDGTLNELTIDTTPPVVDFKLAEVSDSEPIGDNRTIFDIVTLEGSTEPNIPVSLFRTADLASPISTTTSDLTGSFTFSSIDLVLGDNPFTVIATDLVGNEGTSEHTIIREEQYIAYLVEGTNFEVIYEQTFVVPTTPSFLSFTYSNLFFDKSDDFINDAFEAALLDNDGNSLVHRIAGSRDVFFNITEELPAMLGANTVLEGQTVKVDLSHIPSGTDANLVIRLVNNDVDTTTSVYITHISVESGSLGTPVGTTFPVEAAMAADAIDFTLLSDVTASAKAEYGRTSFNEDSGVLYAGLQLKNIGTYVIDTPLVVVIDHLSDPSVHIVDADGVTPSGQPYFDFSALVTGNTLDPSELTNSRDIAFYDPNGVQFSYDLIVLSMLNHAPEFVSDPDVEALAGRPYSYDAEAVDLDGDTLVYSFLSAPQAMTIDPSTGLINWQPSASDTGNHDVLVHVEDGRGGSDEQTYTLSVLDNVPNRPPVFISVPVTEATVGEALPTPTSAFRPGELFISSSLTDEVRVYDSQILMFIQSFTHPLFSEPVSDVGTYGPNGMAFNGRGNLVVAAFSHFVEFSDYGVEFARYPKVTAEATENLIFDKLGNLYTTTSTYGSDRLVQYKASDYTYVQDIFLPASAGALTGITFDDQNRLYVASQSDNRIYCLQASPDFQTFTVVDSWPGPAIYYQLEGLQINQNGELIVAAVDINRYNPDTGELLGSFDAPNDVWPVPLTVDSQGWIYTADFENGSGSLSADIVRFSPDGSSYITVNDPSLFGPFGLAISGTLLPGAKPPTYVYDSDAIDPDGDTIVYSLSLAPVGMVIDPNTGEILWSPTVDQIGQHPVAVIASDGRGGVAVQSYVVAVQPDPANNPPVIISVPITSGTPGQDYIYNVEAIDPDDDPLTYSLAQGPALMTIETTTGVISWGAADIQPGSHDVTVEVTDGRGGSDEQSFTLVVQLGLPTDLTITNVDRSGLTYDGQALTATGTVTAEVTNIGSVDVNNPFKVLFFEDLDHNNLYDMATDNVLGSMMVINPLLAGQSTTFSASVSGSVLFLGNIVWGFVDSGDVILETNETNNLAHSGENCQFDDPDPVAGPIAAANLTASYVQYEIVGEPSDEFFEDFEDGDLTQNPTWTLTPRHLPNPEPGADEIASDPIRPDNLVLKIHGSDAAHRVYATPVDLPLSGFDLSAEYFKGATLANPYLSLGNAQVGSTPVGFSFRFYIFHKTEPYILGLVEVTPDDYYMHDIVISEIPTNEWLRLRLWHDLTDNLIKGEVRLLSDDTLLAQHSFLPITNLCDQSPIGSIAIGAEITTWQYFDNISLTSARANATFTARIGNGGAVPTPAGTSVAFYNGDPLNGGVYLGSTETTMELPPGYFEDVEITLPLAGVTDIWVWADDDGTGTGQVNEYNENDNIYHPGIIIGQPTDLTITNVDRHGLTYDGQALTATGTVTAEVANLGPVDVNNPFEVMFFEDRDHDRLFSEATDNVLGSTTVANPLLAGESITVSAEVSGSVLFVGNIVWGFVDSGDAIQETDELNNLAHSGENCMFIPSIEAFDIALEWKWPMSGEPLPSNTESATTPLVADLDNDGMPEIVFTTYQEIGSSGRGGVLRAIHGDGSGTYFSVDLTSNPQLALHADAPLAIGDLDLDGNLEIVALAESGTNIICFNADGSLKWISQTVEGGPSFGGAAAFFGGGPTAVAQIDISTPTREILYGRQIVDAFGNVTLLGSGDISEGFGDTGWDGRFSILGDLDLDGIPEIIAGNTAYAADGTVLWQATDGPGGSLLPDGKNAIANFDNDPFPEIVLVADGNVYMLDQDGSLIWGPIAIPYSGPNGAPYPGPPTGGPPTIADFDGDGEPEIGVAERGNYVVIEPTGTIRWTHPTSDGSGITGSTAFDFNGDGAVEIVYSDEVYLYVLDGYGDGLGGTFVRGQIPLSSGTATEMPIVADVDADGQTEIITSADLWVRGGQESGIYVFGSPTNSWMPARSIWNQHAYNITNVNDDGTIPTDWITDWQLHNTYRCNIWTDPDDPNPRPAANLTASYVRHEVVDEPSLDFFEGFEDGDLTQNPTWTFLRPLEPGADEIASDPIRPDNLVLKIHGSDANPRVYTTPVDLPLSGFDLSVEFLPTAYFFNPHILVSNDEVSIALIFYRRHDLPPDRPPRIRVWVYEVVGGSVYQHDAPSADISANAWLRLHLWHDMMSGQVHGEVRLVSDNTLIAQLSFAPETDLWDQSIGSIAIGAEEVPWQYLDNIHLTSHRTTFTARVRVGNGGAVSMLAGTSVAFYDGDPQNGGVYLGSTETTMELPPGYFEDVEITLPLAGVTDIWVWADDDGTGTGQVNECNENDNIYHPGIIIGEPTDLTISNVDRSGLTYDGQALTVTGTVTAEITNLGSIDVTDPFNVLFFEDLNHNNLYDMATDNVLGSTIVTNSLLAGESITVSADVSGSVLFLGNIVWGFVDSSDAIPETDELNNLAHSGENCQFDDPVAGPIAAANLTASYVRDETGGSAGDFFDGFEDGDYTVDPLWEDDNATVGPATISADPVRPSNLAVQIHGSDTAHRTLVTEVEVPFAGFDCSMEFLATADLFNPVILVWNGKVSIGLYFSHRHGWPSDRPPEIYVYEVVYEGVERDEYKNSTPTPEISTNTWYRLHMWHDMMSGEVHCEIRLVSDNTLIAQLSYAPQTDLWDQAPISGLLIGAEEVPWQYLDNIHLTSHSTTFTARVGNGGAIPAPAGVSVVFYDGDPRSGGTYLGSTQTTVALDPGYFEDIQIVLPVANISDLWVWADDDGTGQGQVNECNEDDNIYHPGIAPGELKNNAPLITSVPSTDATVGQVYRYDAVATDPDGDPLIFDLPVRPNGMAVDTSSGIVVWTPKSRQEGVHDVLLRVQDGRGGVDLQSFQVTVAAENTPPIITSTPWGPAAVGVLYKYQTTAQDAEGDPLTFGLNTAPSGMVIDSLTGLVTWTPAAAQVGSHTVLIQVDDGQGNLAMQSFDLPVVAVSVNDPPAINSIPRGSIALGQTYLYQIEATDPNNDPLTYSLDTAPAGMTVDNVGLVQWVPTSTQFGINAVEVRIEDGRGGWATQTFTVDVVTQASNNIPQIVSTPVFIAIVAQEYAYDAKGTDADGDPLFWSLDSAPTGMSINGSEGTVRWTPSVIQTGDHQIIIRVLDGQGGWATQSYTLTVHAVNIPPGITSIPPTQAFVGYGYNYTVQATDPNGDVLQYSLNTAPSGMTVDSGTGLIQWTPDIAQIGNWAIEIFVDDGRGGQATQTYNLLALNNVPNQPPVIISIPSLVANVGDLYQYDVNATDPEGDAILFSLTTAPAGMTIDTNTGLLQWTPTLSQLGLHNISIVASDTSGEQAQQAFSIAVSSNNQAPVIQSFPTAGAVVGLLWSYDVVAHDPDGDPLTYSLGQAPAGMSIDQYGRTRWIPAPGDAGTHQVEIIVSDSLGAATIQAFSLPVIVDTQPPNIFLVVSDNPAELNTYVTLTALASDNVGVQSLLVTMAGTPVVLDGNGQATLLMDTVGNFDITMTTTDTSGNTTNGSLILIVIDTSDVTAPVVSITSPVNGATISTFTDIIGIVDDTNLLSYSLEVAPASGGAFTEIANGTSIVIDGLLGVFHPSVLTNDTYILRLTATDAGGNWSSVQIEVSVAGELKLGNFRLSFTDLVIPVSGIPITVTRTYDSLNAESQNDLGYGWRLEISDTNLTTSLPKTGMENIGVFSGFEYGTRVYVTTPGGRREGFTFEPVPVGGFAAIVGAWLPAFTPDPGVTSQLSVANVYLQYVPTFGEFRFYNSGQLYNPADTIYGSDGIYTLTTQDGLVYKIDALTGDLQTLSDTNNNTLTFAQNSITSSAGVSIDFERDAMGRITAVIDPSGNRITYAYDAAGDLVSVTDREGNVTQFVYRTDPAHYLDEIIDPLGHTGVRSDYDTLGRLISMTDASGNIVGIAHDPSNMSETVTDTLGNNTIYVYDNRGNIITEVDALGNITQRTYDPYSNDMLTETDPLGNTTAYTYDSHGNILTQTDPLGNTTISTYGSYNRLLTITDPLGNTTTNTYDSKGNLLSTTDALGNTTTYTYDAAGNMTSVTDPLGNVNTYQYDSSGNLISQTDVLGNVTTYTYDANGNQMSMTNALGNVTTYQYNASGNLISQIDALGNVTVTEYDAVGKVSATIDALGNRTEYIYDERGQLIQTIYPDGTSTTTEYDAAGRVIAQIDALGLRTQFVYDASGRQIETIYPDGARTATTYDATGRMVVSIDALGNRTEFEYDAAGRQILVRDALGNETTSTYDAAGRMTATTDALGNTTQYVYDALGRVVQTILADGSVKSKTYDALSHAIAETDQAGRTTQFEYDALGRLTAVVDALGQRTQYTYDSVGNHITQTDANGNTMSFEYDAAGRRTATILPLGQRSQISYNAVGLIITTTDFNGDTITYDYDVRNRLTAKNYPDGTSMTYTYTLVSQRETVTDSRGTTTYAYDVRGRLLSRTDPDSTTISYTYDAAGNRLSVTIPSGTTNYTFDALNRMATGTDPDGGVTTYTYDAVGRLIQTDLPNGTVDARTYDSLHHLLKIEHSNSAGIFASFTYTYDAIGNRISVTEFNGRQVDYTYDALNRLVSESITDAIHGNRTISYTYDPVGNRLSRIDSAVGTTTYLYDANDRLLTETLGTQVTAYTYDFNGNTLTKDDGTTVVTYHWNYENRLVAVDTDGDGVIDVSYQYDADGIRVSKTKNGQETRFLIDANRPYAQVLEEYVPGGATMVSYIYGTDLISQKRNSGTSYYHVDGLGSTRTLTDGTGTITDNYIYDAYGRTIAQTGPTPNLYLFAGEQRDHSIGLDYLRARYISPGLGRFFGMDSFVGMNRYPLSLHRYVYANLNPLTFTDPSGYISLPEVMTVQIILPKIVIHAAITAFKALPAIATIAFFYKPGFAVRNQALALMSHIDIPAKAWEEALKAYRIGSEIIALGRVFQKKAQTFVTFVDIALAYVNLITGFGSTVRTLRDLTVPGTPFNQGIIELFDDVDTTINDFVAGNPHPTLAHTMTHYFGRLGSLGKMLTSAFEPMAEFFANLNDLSNVFRK